ncbi:MAG: guanylate kinase [Chloroflexi bacterium]|jgi:guanylate kinase|nr:guanylate kinase [Chloroflexota bacterium]
MNTVLVVISGCSGVGKDAILVRMKELGLSYFYAVTATSRPKRPGEIDGVDYHFINKPAFEKMMENGEFLEWANVYGNLYGVPKRTVREAMAEGKDAIVKVDIQGAATIKNIMPEAITIFIAPPSLEELQRRLVKRKTESGTDLELRLETAQKEMESIPLFDYVVVSHNNAIDQAIADIEAIIVAGKRRQ